MIHLSQPAVPSRFVLIGALPLAVIILALALGAAPLAAVEEKGWP